MTGQKKHRARICLLLGVLISAGVCADDVTPRWPQMLGNATHPAGQEEGLSAVRGEVVVSGALLSSPCLLSEFGYVVTAPLSALSSDVRTVTLALECGDSGATERIQRGAPMGVTHRLVSASAPGRATRAHFHDGYNRLTMTLPNVMHSGRLELDYD